MKITVTEYDLENYPSDHPRFEAKTQLDSNLYGVSWVIESGNTRDEAVKSLRLAVSREKQRYESLEARSQTQQNPLNVELIDG